MKKLLALALALIMVFSLMACGGPDSEGTSGPGGEGTTNPVTNDFPGAVLTFQEVKDGGAITIVWTLTLRVDGTFFLEESNPMGTTEHSGESYTVDGDTVTCTGLEPFEMSDIFNVTSFKATFNEQHFAPEGYELAEPTSDHLSDYQTVPGTYEYEDYKADWDFSIYWTLVLKEDGTFTLTEDNMITGALDEHSGASYEIDGDLVTLHGLEPFPMDDIFKKTDLVVITSADMTFIPKEALNSGSGGGSKTDLTDVSYIFNEVKNGGGEGGMQGPGGEGGMQGPGGEGGMQGPGGEGGMPALTIVWTLTLKADGTFTLTENNPFAGTSEHTGTSYTIDGNTIALKGLEPFAMSDIFNVENLNVTFNEAYFAPEGYELQEVVLYTFEEEKDTGITLTWTLLLKEDGSFVLTEINPNFNDPKVYHGSEYEIDGNNVHCGHMEDGPAMGDWAVETNGFNVIIDTETLTFEPVV